MTERHYGHLLENWAAARAQMRAILVACARSGQMITYSDLSRSITAVHLPPYSYALSGMLAEICREEEAAGRPELAVLVVRKSDGRPGNGYFRAALARGLQEGDMEAYWQEQFALATAYWAGRGDSAT
jgi:hypothetical protein